MSSRFRLDLLLLNRKLVSTRTKAQELIFAGGVSVNGVVIKKPGEKFAEDSRIDLLSEESPFVSRAGQKLEAAFAVYPFVVEGRAVLDVGISTGGFAQCLLNHGARLVIGVDVGREQLSPQLTDEKRILLFEQQDIRKFDSTKMPELVDRFTVDVSFISLRLVLPVLKKFLLPLSEGIVLVKPQFELSARELGSGGIVRDAALHEKALQSVSDAASDCGYRVLGFTPCPVRGSDGNQEFLLHVVLPSSA